jgi:phosphoribosylanthranilate isomerase
LRIKICGITTPEDARSAAEVGADAVGLNFVGGPRRIDLKRAREIVPVALCELTGAWIAPDVLELLAAFRVSHVQLYGQPDAAAIVALAEQGFRPIPVLKVADGEFATRGDEWLQRSAPHRPAAILLDAYDPAREGGTGRAFRWEWVAEARDAGKLAGWPPIVLAGGLRPENVADAVRVVRPYGVDVSSGVELDGQPGRKDLEKMRAFVSHANDAAHSESSH